MSFDRLTVKQTDTSIPWNTTHQERKKDYCKTWLALQRIMLSERSQFVSQILDDSIT